MVRGVGWGWVYPTWARRVQLIFTKQTQENLDQVYMCIYIWVLNYIPTTSKNVLRQLDPVVRTRESFVGSKSLNNLLITKRYWWAVLFLLGGDTRCSLIPSENTNERILIRPFEDTIWKNSMCMNLINFISCGRIFNTRMLHIFMHPAKSAFNSVGQIWLRKKFPEILTTVERRDIDIFNKRVQFLWALCKREESNVRCPHRIF